jgi:hypothetical protein
MQVLVAFSRRRAVIVILTEDSLTVLVLPIIVSANGASC